MCESKRQEMSLRTGQRKDGWKARGLDTSTRTNKSRAKRGAFDHRGEDGGEGTGQNSKGS